MKNLVIEPKANEMLEKEVWVLGFESLGYIVLHNK